MASKDVSFEGPEGKTEPTASPQTKQSNQAETKLMVHSGGPRQSMKFNTAAGSCPWMVNASSKLGIFMKPEFPEWGMNLKNWQI